MNITHSTSTGASRVSTAALADGRMEPLAALVEVFGSHKAAPMDLRTFFEEHPKECEKLAGECHKAYRPEHLGFVQLTGF